MTLDLPRGLLSFQRLEIIVHWVLKRISQNWIAVAAVVFCLPGFSCSAAAQAITPIGNWKAAAEADPFAKAKAGDLIASASVAGHTGVSVTVEADCGNAESSQANCFFTITLAGARFDAELSATDSFGQANVNRDIDFQTRLDDSDPRRWSYRGTEHEIQCWFNPTDLAASKRLLIGFTSNGSKIVLSIALDAPRLAAAIRSGMAARQSDIDKERQQAAAAESAATADAARKNQELTDAVTVAIERGNPSVKAFQEFMGQGEIPSDAIMRDPDGGYLVYVKTVRFVRAYYPQRALSSSAPSGAGISRLIRDSNDISHLTEPGNDKGSLPMGSVCAIAINRGANQLGGTKYLRASCDIGHNSVLDAYIPVDAAVYTNHSGSPITTTPMFVQDPRFHKQ